MTLRVPKNLKPCFSYSPPPTTTSTQNQAGRQVHTKHTVPGCLIQAFPYLLSRGCQQPPTSPTTTPFAPHRGQRDPWEGGVTTSHRPAGTTRLQHLRPKPPVLPGGLSHVRLPWPLRLSPLPQMSFTSLWMLKCPLPGASPDPNIEEHTSVISEPGVLRLSTCDIWGRVILCGGDCPVHCGVWRSIPSPSPLKMHFSVPFWKWPRPPSVAALEGTWAWSSVKQIRPSKQSSSGKQTFWDVQGGSSGFLFAGEMHKGSDGHFSLRHLRIPA